MDTHFFPLMTAIAVVLIAVQWYCAWHGSQQGLNLATSIFVAFIWTVPIQYYFWGCAACEDRAFAIILLFPAAFILTVVPIVSRAFARWYWLGEPRPSIPAAPAKVEAPPPVPAAQVEQKPPPVPAETSEPKPQPTAVASFNLKPDWILATSSDRKPPPTPAPASDPKPSADRFDIIIAGAGHNSLVAAAYLSKAGYRCLVLEGRNILGGNVVTEELTLPGFRHDSCGTAHVILQDNPLIRNDELGLADYGLEYIQPEIVCHMPFLDGACLTQYHDIERTIGQFAKFSRKDADAYRRMIAEYESVKPLFDAVSYTPVGFGKSINDRLADHPDGRKWLRRQAQSAWEIIRDNFEDDHCRSFMLWMAFQTVTPPEWPMTGRLAYSLVWGRQRWSWCIPKGGSGVLTEILMRFIQDHGGVALTNKMVQRLIVENGRCNGVECADGSSYYAERAVLSTIHIKHLIDMAPRNAWPDDFIAGVETWQGGPTLFVSHYATTEPMTFGGDDGPITPIACAMLSEPTRALRMGYDFARGVPNVEEPVLLAVSPTIGDPSQAPPGRHTIKIIGMQPYDLKEGPQHWDNIKDQVADANLNWLRKFSPNLTADKILARTVESPLDLERRNPHNWHGSCHGGAQNAAQTGALRPAAGWAQHRMPITNLYQTGSTTHPGGSISGGPGRNAAIVMLTDFGRSLEQVVAKRAPRRSHVTTPAD
ncbi:MAG TPA: FAD-dependent oxidoreductase [Xanthobacteraceae bacterium]|nr:FAD-dependent oxidoreductase [Xanthobacteraceae bacterium]